MSNNQDITEKRHAFTDCDEKYICKVRRNDHNYRQVYEYDKKMKREIANSNERRRMQSINMGFETLKQLLPMTMDGEKLSKASILQFTAKYIQSLIARLTTLEKEVASYKKSMLNSKERIPSTKSTSVIQEQNRKRRLNSCTVNFEIAQTETNDSNLDLSTSNFPVLNQDNSLITGQTSEKTPGSLEHLVAAIEQVEGEKFYIGSTNNISGMQSQIMKEINSGSSSIVESNNDSFEILDQQPSVNSISNASNIVLNSLDVKKQSANNASNSSVMKPTISPYTEKIILAVSQHPHMFENSVSNYSLNVTTQPTYQIISNEPLIDSTQTTTTTPTTTTTTTGYNRHFVGSQRVSIPHKYLHRPDVALQKNHTL